MAPQVGETATIINNGEEFTGKVFYVYADSVCIEYKCKDHNDALHFACGSLVAIKYNGEIGCLIDGHWGIYGSARMAAIAEDYGYSNSEILDIAHRMLNSSTVCEVTPEESEKLDDYNELIEQWLNEHVAIEGHSFGWQDGEFFYQPQRWWEMEAN